MDRRHRIVDLARRASASQQPHPPQPHTSSAFRMGVVGRRPRYQMACVRRYQMAQTLRTPPALVETPHSLQVQKPSEQLRPTADSSFVANM